MATHAHIMAGRPIYFPFLSGLLTYDCARCDARCCRGAQLGIGRSRELVGLLSISPALGLLAAPDFSQAPMPGLQSPVDACWFLDKKQRCRLEWAVGREHKPASCRLFPFHLFRLAGEHLVVMPHFLCPLQVADAPSLKGPTSYDALTLEMHRTGVPRDGHLRMPPPPDMPWSDAILLERQVRRLSLRHLNADDYIEFAQEQDFVTLGRQGRTLAAGGMERVYASVASLLGVTRALSARSVRELVALTPYLRMRGTEVARSAMPAVLCATAAFVAAMEAVPGTHMSPRGIVQLFENRLPLLYLLAHLHEAPSLLPAYSADQLLRSAGSQGQLFARLLREVDLNGRRSRPRSLLQIIEHESELDAPLRPDAVSALWRLGRYLADAGSFDID